MASDIGKIYVAQLDFQDALKVFQVDVGGPSLWVGSAGAYQRPCVDVFWSVHILV